MVGLGSRPLQMPHVLDTLCSYYVMYESAHRFVGIAGVYNLRFSVILLKSYVDEWRYKIRNDPLSILNIEEE